MTQNTQTDDQTKSRVRGYFKRSATAALDPLRPLLRGRDSLSEEMQPASP